MAQQAPAPASIQPDQASLPAQASPLTHASSRWLGWAYLYARPGAGRTLAAGGQLGGSQAAARVAYRVTDGISLAARAYAPLGAKGAEVAGGLDLTVAGPIHAIAERRVGIDRYGRDAWAAYLTGGIYREYLGFVVDGYAQGGVVGARRRDLFVDGAARVGRRLGEHGPLIGAGGWGAAQPGASRLDVGPRVSWTVPGVGLTTSVEGRLRVAGRARPGSGVALTLARDF